jgi:hypothetical protein|tara:strand:+ start:1803 stop:2231 length:429 start_codon:yes stop_codon:yes gene_type:complete
MNFEFKHPTKYKNTKNNTDKIMPGSGDLSEKEKLINLAMSETVAEELKLQELMDMEYGEALLKFLDKNPGKTEDDFIELFRVPMESGGKIIDFAAAAKAREPKVKKLSLGSLFAPGKLVSELTEAERDKVNLLLKMTFGNKD